MEDARKAERLLERLRLSEFELQISQQSATKLLDGACVSMLQVFLLCATFMIV